MNPSATHTCLALVALLAACNEEPRAMMMDMAPPMDMAQPAVVHVLAFADATTRPAPTMPSALLLADVDGDGVPEILVTASGSNQVLVLPTRGGADSAWPTGPVPVALAVADFNGDKLPDVITANARGANVSLLLGTPAHGFEMPRDTMVGDDPTSVTAGDFDGDGRIDMAFTRFERFATYNAGVFLGLGDGRLAPGKQLNAGLDPMTIRAVDLDGNNVLDLVAVAWTGGRMMIMRGHGDGMFDFPVEYEVGMHPFTVAAGDVDGDGRLDLVTSDDGAVVILPGKDGVTFGVPRRIDVPGASAIAIADLDRDGIVDIAVTDVDMDSVRVLVGRGGGAFQLASDRFPTGKKPVSIAAGDLDGDGKPDLVVAAEMGDVVNVLLNKSH